MLDTAGWRDEDYTPESIAFAQFHGLPYPGEIPSDRTPYVMARLEFARETFEEEPRMIWRNGELTEVLY